MSLIWVCLLRKRKRSRSNSPPLGLSKMIRSRSPDLDSPKLFRIVVRTMVCGEAGVKYFVFKIPTNELKWLADVDVHSYTRHDHCHSDPTRFRKITKCPRYLHSVPLTPHSMLAIVGRKMYALFFDEERRCLDFESLDLKYGTATLLPPPTSPNRNTPKIISLRGKVYLLGGLIPQKHLQIQPFGEVFDPRTNTWSTLSQPPKAAALVSRDNIFVASLGESEAKFMVYDYDTQHPIIYIYAILADQWKTYHLTPALHRIFEPRFMYGHEVINEDDANLYWLDERHACIYAFDWKAMQLYSGPIVGMEHTSVLKSLDECASGTVLIHLWADFFCLLWSDFVRDGSLFPDTECHFAFLRIIKCSRTTSVTAFVLGCFMDSTNFQHDIFDAIRV